MKLSEIITMFSCVNYTPELVIDKEISYAFCADLMSDALMVLNSVKDDRVLESCVLITGLTTNQSIRTAEMLDINVVLLVRGKIPSSRVIELAKESNILLLSTTYTMFNTSGMMYSAGIKGVITNQQW